MGTITQQNDKYTINVWVVDIATGTQVLTASALTGRSDELDQKYATLADGGESMTPPDDTPDVVRLFDEFDPIVSSDGFSRKMLGTCCIAGRLYDDCVAYDGWHDQYCIFDLKSSPYTRLRAVIGGDETNWDYHRANLSIQCDGRVAFEADIRSEDQPKLLDISLRGGRQLRIDIDEHGFVVPGDFQLIR